MSPPPVWLPADDDVEIVVVTKSVGASNSTLEVPLVTPVKVIVQTTANPPVVHLVAKDSPEEVVTKEVGAVVSVSLRQHPPV